MVDQKWNDIRQSKMTWGMKNIYYQEGWSMKLEYDSEIRRITLRI